MKREIFEKLREERKKDKGEIEKIIKTKLKKRKRRKVFANKNLLILAVDHPARGGIGYGNDEIAFARRYEILSRIVDVLSMEGIDGVLATPDLMEDLVLISYITGEEFLNDKILMGSMNRLGIANSAFELLDMPSAYTPSSIADYKLDAGKLMVRINFDDERTLEVLKACKDLMNECHDYSIPVFVETFPVRWENGKLKKYESIPDLIKCVSIISGLSKSSAGIYLKLPYIEKDGRYTYRDVIEATTYPVLILGGGKGSEKDFLKNFRKAMDYGASGGIIGRKILFAKNYKELSLIHI